MPLNVIGSISSNTFSTCILNWFNLCCRILNIAIIRIIIKFLNFTKKTEKKHKSEDIFSEFVTFFVFETIEELVIS